MMNMENNSSGKKIKKKESQKVGSNKLDFLLDSIETEVADLAEPVVPQGSIVNETAPTDEESTEGLSHEPINDLDLDMDFFEDLEEPPTDSETVDKQTAAALDALSDAEGEVEAMLTAEGVATDIEDVAVEANSEPQADKEAAKALTELLATREVDASKFLENAEVQAEAPAEPPAIDAELSEDLFSELDIEPASRRDDSEAAEPPALADELADDLFAELSMESESEGAGAEAVEPTAVDDELPRDLFSELDKEIQSLSEVAEAAEPTALADELADDLFAELDMETGSAEDHAVAAETPATKDELSEDLFSDLDMAYDPEENAAPTSEPPPSAEKLQEEPLAPEDESSDDLLAELGLESAVEEKEVKPAEVSASRDADDNELAILMTNKIEALVTRLVEERLTAIAERIINEKLNKIIASMK
jgi:hypothetical protein